MALTYSKRLYLLLCKNNNKNVLLTQGSKIQYFVPVVHFSDATDSSTVKPRNSVQNYLEKTAKANEFMKQQIEEYELGKKFLASMMGTKSKQMTQEDIDNAIDYLFPSSLYVPRARPLMKPPEEIHGKVMNQEVDETGRPFNYLFYTLKPNYSQCLHDAAETLQKLNELLYKNKTPPEPLSLAGKKWLTQEELSEKFDERVFDVEYEKFLEIFTKLSGHPFASEAEGFIKNYWKVIEKRKESTLTPTVVKQDNITVSTIEGTRRKTATARVSVSHPGSGNIRINNMGLDYFIYMTPREQVIFPLLFTNLLGKVDVDATVEGGNFSSQAGAIRLGVSLALEPLVSPDMFLEMKLAGLLQADVRVRERKKPGKEGARRSYTWLKR